MVYNAIQPKSLFYIPVQVPYCHKFIELLQRYIKPSAYNKLSYYEFPNATILS